MYDYLGVRYRVQTFLFSFSRLSDRDCSVTSQDEERHYFVHASNNHRVPPIRPKSASLIVYLAELLCALLCYIWFSLCCLFVSTQDHHEGRTCESFDEYLRRIMLPRYFVRYYLLPLMSAVTTCPHKDLLNFPAKDVVDYKRCITSGRQLTVMAGVNDVQSKLTKGLQIHCSAQVTAVKEHGTKLMVQWRATNGNQQSSISERLFDKVVLAVPPNVVGSIFEPLRKEMQRFPTIPVETVVHRDLSVIAGFGHSIRDGMKNSWITASDSVRAHIVHLRTLKGTEVRTEATHVQPSGVMVTSCPLSKCDQSKVLSYSRFTRVLRTPESRQATNRLFEQVENTRHDSEKQLKWVNGNDGVYLVGSWCWDGMVLLEGCVVSAMRTAESLGVNIPWKGSF